MTIGCIHYFVLALILFSLGLLGVILRRNVIIVMMSIELMLNAANLLFIAFSRYHGSLDGQITAIFIMAVAAAEAAVGLAIVIAIFRHNGHVDLDRYNLLKG